MNYIVSVIENLIILYFAVYFLFDIFLFFYALSIHRKKNSKNEIDYSGHSISIIVPAYNEEVSIISCVQMLSGVDYEDVEIIVVNDGSSDRTLEKLLEAYPFEIKVENYESNISSAKVLSIRRSNSHNIVLLDKENGGKADSINAAINYASKRYICTIDADSILDVRALKMVVAPMIEDPRVFVSGGFLATSNDIILEGKKVVHSPMPSNAWVLWQIVEYLKSFMISRLALSRLNMLLVMSGAFSLFKKEDLLKVGGFLSEHNDHPCVVKMVGHKSKTVCEDMEIIVRLWRFHLENRLSGKAVFLPNPVCWTEVPDKGKNLYKQRVRWHQGLGETLRFHKIMMFEPFYKTIGLAAMPYYFFFEFLAPLVKVFSLLFLTTLSLVGFINASWMLLLLLSSLLITTLILSVITVILEIKNTKERLGNRSTLRYATFWDWLKLLGFSILGSFSYEFFKVFAQLKGMINIALHKHEWNKFERKGIHLSTK